MSIYGDLKKAWVRHWELRDKAPQFTQFTHKLARFPLPVTSDLPHPLPKIAIATPCKDAARNLERYFGLTDNLDYPKDRMHLLMLEGDSTDDTYEVAERSLAARTASYASTSLAKLDLGYRLPGARWGLQLQRKRRAAIAACRNALLRTAMETDADYILFIDSDMAEIPPHSLRQLLAYGAPIMVANCLEFETMDIFDANAFLYTRPLSDRLARAYVEDEVYQPPSAFFRHYPDPETGDPIEPLDSVGGTFLLIRRDVIEAGVDFPEEPYQLHIETEGFALKASECGFGAFMLPRLIVRHGPN